jgi:carbonic anhydrase/acetyltransferase-like protein (isoleucine patch superfamily)
VQDGAVLHVDPGYPMSVGANVTVAHQAMLHGCTIGDGSLIGIQAIVYNKAIIGRDCLIAAGEAPSNEGPPSSRQKRTGRLRERQPCQRGGFRSAAA